jgi:hypothetical protein
VDDFEPFWKVVRRGRFERVSTSTFSMAEGIGRITHALLVHASANQHLLTREAWATHGPRVDIRPVLPPRGKDDSDPETHTFDQLTWAVSVDYPGAKIPWLPVVGRGVEPEDALEVVFNLVSEKLKEDVAERLKEVTRLRDEADGLESIAREIEENQRLMGYYNGRQLNLREK